MATGLEWPRKMREKAQKGVNSEGAEERRFSTAKNIHPFTHGRWFVKYRATYPAVQQARAEPAIRAFIAELAWP